MAHALATLDETFQEERWGVDEEAAAIEAVDAGWGDTTRLHRG